MLADIQPQIGGNLLVAATAGVQLVTHFASHCDQARFHVVMHVFNGRVIRLGHTIAPDLLERGQRGREFVAAQHTGLRQRGSVRLARGNFVGQQHAVERKRPLPLLELGIRPLIEAARPHLHCTASFGCAD